MLATLFIPAIQTFLLPALKDTWQRILWGQQDLDKDVARAARMTRVAGTTAKVDEAIKYFENLIEDIRDHCKIVDH